MINALYGLCNIFSNYCLRSYTVSYKGSMSTLYVICPMVWRYILLLKEECMVLNRFWYEVADLCSPNWNRQIGHKVTHVEISANTAILQPMSSSWLFIQTFWKFCQCFFFTFQEYICQSSYFNVIFQRYCAVTFILREAYIQE